MLIAKHDPHRFGCFKAATPGVRDALVMGVERARGASVLRRAFLQRARERPLDPCALATCN